jgi:hypothetical protein
MAMIMPETYMQGLGRIITSLKDYCSFRFNFWQLDQAT